MNHLKLDTDSQVFFYEQDHYYLSNFSAFQITFCGHEFATAEHAYHWSRFEIMPGPSVALQAAILATRSAHDAFTIAQSNKWAQRLDWNEKRVPIMREILWAKQWQHEHVRRKLLQTGERELIENSWRDDFWGWGPNRDGKNMLGKLWMEIRNALRASTAAA